MTTSASAEPAAPGPGDEGASSRDGVEIDPEAIRARLRRDGFCPVGALVPGATLAGARATSEGLLAGESAGARAALRSLGSLIPVFRDAAFAPLIEAPATLSLMRALGEGEARFAAGYFLSKPGGSPATFWHQDWGFWHDPVSYDDRLVEVGILIYLVDVDERNGAPRFLPGSHRRRHPLHALLAATEVAALRRADDPTGLAYQGQDGAVTVPVRAGEAVLFDPRVLHGAHANVTDADRPALVLWYYVDLAALAPPVRAFVGDGDPLAGWPDAERARLMPLLPPPVEGVVKATLAKHPDERLR
jgi:phytanoyl-CoA hydroxylase